MVLFDEYLGLTVGPLVLQSIECKPRKPPMARKTAAFKFHQMRKIVAEIDFPDAIGMEVPRAIGKEGRKCPRHVTWGVFGYWVGSNGRGSNLHIKSIEFVLKPTESDLRLFAHRWVLQ